MIFNLFDALFDFFSPFLWRQVTLHKNGSPEWMAYFIAKLPIAKQSQKNNIIIETVAKQALSASWGEVIEIVRHVSISGG